MTSIVLKKLGPPIASNLYYNTIKMLLERCSSVMIDAEALKVIIILHSSSTQATFKLQFLHVYVVVVFRL